jgi:hypothetical protein
MNAVTEPASTAEMIPPVSLQRAAGRLAGITGFVTALHGDSDERAAVFSRYFHVRRVAWTATWLCRTIGEAIDYERVSWLAWAHDLNRWPFAHNSERGSHAVMRRFDQGQDVPRYLKSAGISCDAAAAADLRGILDKTSDHLTPEARLTLLADMGTGLIEDALFAVVGLDLDPSFIGPEVTDALLFPTRDDDFRRQLLGLDVLLNVDRKVEKFVKEFDRLFIACIIRFLSFHCSHRDDPLTSEAFKAVRGVVKEKFLRGRLFPYNNENVSRGSKLRSELISPVLDILGESSSDILTSIDEYGLMSMARAHKLFEPDQECVFYPRLDYVT